LLPNALVTQEEQVQGTTQEQAKAKRELEEIRKCINEECFRWGVGLCMSIKRDYWDSYLKCFSVHVTSPDLVPTLDKCHERALNEIMPRYSFLSKDAIMECIIS